MRSSSKRWFAGWVLAICAAGVGQAAEADWPSRPVKIVVPSPPGGPTDRVGRLLANALAKKFSQSFIVENRASAGSIVGIAAVAKSAPDGYTLGITSALNTISASLYKNVPFNIVTDLSHVNSISENPQLLVVRSDYQANTLSAFIDYAKAHPGEVNYASSGSGSSGHLTMELFQSLAQIKLTQIPYKGAAPALQDLLGGSVPAMVVSQEIVLPHVKTGAVRVLAVSSAKRSVVFPDVPTFAESGFPELVVRAWLGVSAPKNTPDAVVKKLHAAIVDAVSTPEFQAQLTAGGYTPFLFPEPSAFANFVADETQRWAAVIKQAGIKAD